MPTLSFKQPSKKEIEFARREQVILSASLALFKHNPNWEQVTVEKIARKADIGKGTVYKHFTCKEEIYAHIAIDFTKRLLDAFRPAADAPEVLEILKDIIRIAFELFIQNPAEARVSFYCKRQDFRDRLNDDLKQQFESLDLEFDSFVGAILQSGIRSGLFPNKPVEHLMLGLEATFDGAIGMIWNGMKNYQKTEDQENFINIVSEYMLAGLVGLNVRAEDRITSESVD